jgi:hypothetical protein
MSKDTSNITRSHPQKLDEESLSSNDTEVERIFHTRSNPTPTQKIISEGHITAVYNNSDQYKKGILTEIGEFLLS